MVQWLRALAAHPEHLSSVPSTISYYSQTHNAIATEFLSFIFLKSFLREDLTIQLWLA